MRKLTLTNSTQAIAQKYGNVDTDIVGEVLILAYGWLGDWNRESGIESREEG
jgi:hypothetical protein